MSMTARRVIGGGLVVLLAVLLLGRLAADGYVSFLWFRSLGYESVFWVRVRAVVISRVLFALLTAAVVIANLRLVLRSVGAIRLRRRYGNLEIAERVPRSYVAAGLLAVGLLSAWWLSAAASGPVELLAALHAVPWGMADPVFGRDLSFYVFRLPVLDSLQNFAGLLVFWTLLLCVVGYALTGALRWSGSAVQVSGDARRHLIWLVSALLFIFALDLWLDRYDLLFAGSGVERSFGYTDAVARIPARTIIALLAAAAALSVGFAGARANPRPALISVALVLFAAALGELVIPGLVQRFEVEPTELAREEPYLRRHIAFTRYAFGLTDMDVRPLPYRGGKQLDTDAIAQAVQRLPLWDPRPLLQSYRSLEERREYYRFTDAHADRYDGEPVIISAREIEPAAASTWRNRHLTFVRGEGVVVTPATRPGGSGEPPFFISDVCPVRVAADAPASMQLDDAGIYFGRRTDQFIVTNAATADGVLQCEGGDTPAGVPLDGALRRVAFAWAFQSTNLLLSGDITAESRLVFNREISRRAASIAPFFQFLDGEGAEQGALPVVFEGRIVWLLDGYISTPSFPLAQTAEFGGRLTRYVRNSAKVTIDAVSGDVAVYATDNTDPVIRTYDRIFPGLIRPLAEMPRGLREHLRYPAPLLRLQASVLQAYHVTASDEFYSREVLWTLPTESYRDEMLPVQPVYSTLRLPGEPEFEFALSIPFTAAGRQNMTALLVARNDPPHYGSAILYELPGEAGVLGPQQVESLIDQDSRISEQLSLWKQGGSNVIRGHLLIVPVDSSLLYAEPLYLEAQASAIPQLERVVLVRGDQVVMERTMSGAVAALTGGAPPVPANGSRPEAAPAATVAESPALTRARRILREADERLRAGDWAGFGAAWQELRELLGTGSGSDGGSN